MVMVSDMNEGNLCLLLFLFPLDGDTKDTPSVVHVCLAYTCSFADAPFVYTKAVKRLRHCFHFEDAAESGNLLKR